MGSSRMVGLGQSTKTSISPRILADTEFKNSHLIPPVFSGVIVILIKFSSFQYFITTITMALRYATNQFKNYVENITIVGAGGTIGSYIARALIAQGKHKINALTRLESKSELPHGLHEIKKVDYSNHDNLVSALKGQEALIITMIRTAPEESQTRLIDAAVEAGVKYILPNEYGASETLRLPHVVKTREYIERVGKGATKWIGFCSGLWYDHSLPGNKAAGGKYRFGFDFGSKTLTLFDDGNTKICVVTWKQTGEAIAKLFALKRLPRLPENVEDKSLTLSQFEDRVLFVNSFTISQRDMFTSVLRVTGDRESEWKVEYENSQERFERGQRMQKSGDVIGSVVWLYARVLFPDGTGDFSQQIMNRELDLPKEDLDEETQRILGSGTY